MRLFLQEIAEYDSYLEIRFSEDMYTLQLEKEMQ